VRWTWFGRGTFLGWISLLAVSRFAGAAEPVARGIGASRGVAVGRATLDFAAADRLALRDAVILLRPDTSTADIAE